MINNYYSKIYSKIRLISRREETCSKEFGNTQLSEERRAAVVTGVLLPNLSLSLSLPAFRRKIVPDETSRRHFSKSRTIISINKIYIYIYINSNFSSKYIYKTKFLSFFFKITRFTYKKKNSQIKSSIRWKLSDRRKSVNK